MGDSRKRLKNRLDLREYLGEVILLSKGSLLTRTMDKYQGTLIAISNCSPSVNWCTVATVKLVLNVRWVASLPSSLSNPLLYRPPSY